MNFQLLSLILESYKNSLTKKASCKSYAGLVYIPGQAASLLQRRDDPVKLKFFPIFSPQPFLMGELIVSPVEVPNLIH